MKVTFLNRARGEFWSIEELFHAIANALPSAASHQTLSVPRTGASARALLANVLWSSRLRDTNIIHITGDIHYVVMGIWRVPTVLTIHDLRFIEEAHGLRGKLLWLLWLYLPVKRARHITVISEFTKRRLLASVKIPQGKLSVIPDCVTPEFEPQVKPQLAEPPVVLHVGTTPNKNLDRLADACCDLNLELCILGRLSEDQKCYLAERSIRYREYFGLGRDEVVKLYQQCDIVSFVSLYEGFGLPVLEGQAIGRPVLTSNIAPMNEVSGGAALHVDPTKVEEIRAALMRLLQDAPLREKLVSDGFENVRKYSAQAVAAQYYDLYNKVVAK